MARKKPDRILFFCTVFLIVLGTLTLFGISAPFSQKTFGRTYWIVAHQIVLGILPGAILGILAFKIKISDLKKLAVILFGINLILVFCVFLPKIGLEFGNAKRWIDLGPVSFQPSEFLKISLFLYLAAWLEKKIKQNWLTLVSFWVILAPAAIALIFQPDISTLLVLIIISFLMYFLAETPLSHSILAVIAGISLVLFLISSAPYRMNRLIVFLSPKLDPMGIGYQIKQTQIAIGSGGIWGNGLGMSKQKFGFVPHPTSDSVFAIFCEETGFLGALVLTILFLIFCTRGFNIAKKTKDKFGKLLSCAICSYITLQAFINIGSMVGATPLAGIPLPFISYGGTHIVVELIGVGILLNISKS